MHLAIPIFSRKTDISSNEEMRCENKNTNSLSGKLFVKNVKISLVSHRRHWARVQRQGREPGEAEIYRKKQFRSETQKRLC